jgi:hypothetical protein
LVDFFNNLPLLLRTERVSFNALVQDLLAFLQVVQVVVGGVALAHDLLDIFYEVLNHSVIDFAELHDLTLLGNVDLLFVEIFFEFPPDCTFAVLLVVHFPLFRFKLQGKVIKFLVLLFYFLVALNLEVVVLGVVWFGKGLGGHFGDLGLFSDVDIGLGVAPLCGHELLVL